MCPNPVFLVCLLCYLISHVVDRRGPQEQSQDQMQFCCGHIISSEAFARLLKCAVVDYVAIRFGQAPSGQYELIVFDGII
jgi:hypothetical protein